MGLGLGCGGGDRERGVEERARDRGAEGEAVDAGRSERGELLRGADAWMVSGSRMQSAQGCRRRPCLPAAGCRRPESLRPGQHVVSHQHDGAIVCTARVGNGRQSAWPPRRRYDRAENAGDEYARRAAEPVDGGLQPACAEAATVCSEAATVCSEAATVCIRAVLPSPSTIPPPVCTPCTCRVHAVHMPCTCRVHAVYMLVRGRAPPSSTASLDMSIWCISSSRADF